MRLADLPAAERPRERLLRQGAAALRDAELLAAVLGTGPRAGGAVATAEALLARFADLRRLAGAGVAELSTIPGVGLAQACRVKAALALADRLAERPFLRGQRLAGPEEVFARVGPRLRLLEHEVFLVLALDCKHRVLGEHAVAVGGACTVDVLPRDVFGPALREAAVAAILVHNHPSGDPNPSGADEGVTRRLAAAGDLLGVKVLDHIIVAQEGFFSFAARRLLPGGGKDGGGAGGDVEPPPARSPPRFLDRSTGSARLGACSAPG